ncbi:MAG: hypothetical protein AAF356_01520 [Planctomycetota bacterium]
MPTRAPTSHAERPNVRLPRVFVVLALLACWLAGPLAQARAQSQVQAGAEQLTAEIQIRVDQFGVGRVAREGDWAGLLVTVTDTGFQQRAVVLRVEGADADGDIPLLDRVVTTNPGVPQSFWLYTRLPFRFESNSSVIVSAHPALDTGGTGEGDLAFGVGPRLLGRTEARPQLVAPAQRSVIGIVGARDFGLSAYQSTANVNLDHAPLGHELTVVQPGLTADRLPDEWQGLMPLSVLVWGRGAGETDPGALTVDQSRAIREWIARGGHLVVVLPAVGQEWTGQASNRLRSLLPAVRTPKRIEGVNLERYRALIAGRSTLPLPTDAVLHELEALDDAGPGEAVPVLAGPGGEVIAMRRQIGAGAVTLIGLDLAQDELRRFNMPDAESFWHRVLGKRGRLVTSQELQSNELSPIANRLNNRDARSFDADLAGEIARTGRSLQGLLLGVVVFVLYWVFAGPLGYFLLGRRGWKRHAWVAFVGVIGAFTALAWTGALAIRPKGVSAAAVTYLEQVYGQPVQRARSWMSVLIPSYGDAAISVPAGDASGLGIGLETFAPIVAPWSPPSLTGAQRFPDNRGYRVSTREPATLEAPTRSTVKQIRVDWAGAPRWQLPTPQGDLGEQGRLSLEREAQRSLTYVTGRLIHGLPAALEDVRIIIIEGQKPIGRVAGTGQMIVPASVFELSDPWEPGVPLDLEGVTRPEGRITRRQTTFGDDRFFGDITRTGAPVNESVVDPRDAADRLMAAMLISQAEPPNERSWSGTAQITGPPLALRSETHAFDLGRHFTTPGVIVIGHVMIEPEDASDDAGPLPLEVNGSPVPISGRTVVTTVFPLEPRPPTTAPIRPNTTPDRTPGDPLGRDAPTD